MARIRDCPGSLALETIMRKRLPPSDSPQAAEGTALHEVLAEEIEEAQVVISAEQEWALAEARRKREEALKAFRVDPCEEMDVFTEQRYWFHTPFIRTKVYSGQIDWMCIPKRRPDFAVMVDWKMGRILVEPAHRNAQIKAYVVLVKRNFPHIKSMGVAIAQPRSYGDKQRRLTLGFYGPEELRAAEQEVIAWISAAQSPAAPRIPSEHACHYCKALHCCPEAIIHWLSLKPPEPQTTES